MEGAQPEKVGFSAGAAFRVYGVGLDFDAITRELGISPDHQHNRGELDPGKRPYAHDMWSLKSPLGTNVSLENHLSWLAKILLPHRQFLSLLRQRYKVDIYCFKSLFTEQASLILSSASLRVFTELDLELAVSLLCLPPESKEENSLGGA